MKIWRCITGVGVTGVPNCSTEHKVDMTFHRTDCNYPTKKIISISNCLGGGEWGFGVGGWGGG